MIFAAGKHLTLTLLLLDKCLSSKLLQIESEEMLICYPCVKEFKKKIEVAQHICIMYCLNVIRNFLNFLCWSCGSTSLWNRVILHTDHHHHHHF